MPDPPHVIAGQSPRKPSRRYSCSHEGCERVFHKAEHLARHERNHLGLKPFACPSCNRHFGRQDSMLRHKKLHDHISSTNDKPSTPVPTISSAAPQALLPTQFAEPQKALPLPQLSPVPGLDELQNSTNFDNRLENEVQHVPESQPSTGTVPSSCLHATDVGAVVFDDFQEVESGFDWAIASEDIFGLLRTEPSVVNLAWPITQYSQYFSDSQTCLTNGSMEGNAPSGSVDASKEAVQAMSKTIKELPAKLVAELENNDVTSTFFDDCMDLFFTRFLPTFQLVHKPTFLAKDCSPTLLLNMLALGSSFLGSKEATAKGESLWSLAHAVVATSWPNLMSQKGPRDSCDGVQLVQTAALGQIYALLSGNYTLRMTSQVFHSLGFYWSRECGMYGWSIANKPIVPSSMASAAEKLDAWIQWASSENQLRALLAHYILDGVIAQFSTNPTCARHAANALPIPASAAAFEATTADDWLDEMNKSKHVGMPFCEFIFALFHANEAIISQPISEFAIRVVLESLQSLVLEEAETGGTTIGTPSRYEICAAMLRLHRWQITVSTNAAELLLRWHCIFLSMTVNTRALCDQICTSSDISEQLFRPRSGQLGRRHFDLHSWAETDDARRALLHAFAVRDIVQNLPLGRSQAIHVPFAIFMAATVQAALLAIEVRVLAVPALIDWEAVWLNSDITMMSSSSPKDTSSIETLQFLQNGFSPENRRLLSRKMSLELHSLRMQLKGIAFNWGICQRMDHIIEQWLHSSKV